MRRVIAPGFWRVGKKTAWWVVTPIPGPHPKRRSFPLKVLVRDVLKLAKNGREARIIIKHGNVLIDGVVRKEEKFPVGLMDTVAIPKVEAYYRVVPYEKGLRLIKIPKEEANKKVVAIIRKQMVNGARVQVTSHDGRNFLDLKDVKPGDSLLIEVPSQKVLEVLRMEPGALALIIKGKRAGKIVRIQKKVGRRVVVEGDRVFELPRDYVMVIGKDKPVVSVYEPDAQA